SLQVLRGIPPDNPTKFERFYWHLNAIWTPGKERSGFHRDIEQIRVEYYRRRGERLPDPPKTKPVSETHPSAKLAKLEAFANMQPHAKPGTAPYDGTYRR